MLTTFHRNALDSTLGGWLGPFGVHQVTVPHPPLGKDKGRGTTNGGEGTRRRATVSSNPRENTPQVTVPLPPITMQSTRDTKQIMQTRGHMNQKMSQELPVGIHVQLYSETGSVCHFFWREYLTLKSCICSTGATGMGSPAAGLAVTWTAGLAALLVEGLARGLAALGAGLAWGLAGGSSPCGKHNLGRHNTAPRTLEIDNTSWVRANMTNVLG